MRFSSFLAGGVLGFFQVASGAPTPESLDWTPSPVEKRTAPTSTFSNNVIFSPPSNAGWTDPRVLYARAIELSDGSLLATWENYSPEPPLVYFPIFKSLDGGVTWSEIGRVKDQVNNWGLRYQPDLYQLPQAIGKYAAGTILCAGSSIPTDLSQTKIDVYASTDGGKTWEFVSSIASGGEARPINGLTPVWEPLLRVYNNKLVCYYSDQRDSKYGQKLVHQTTTDLLTWSSVVDDVHDDNNYSARPGMPAITLLPNGEYIYAYEVCGTDGCRVHMNVWTGLKEAKVNVPDEADPSLEGLPMDRAVVVVDPEGPDTPQIPRGAPAYEAVGKVKEPKKQPDNDFEGTPFFEAIKLLKKGTKHKGKEFDVALEGMENLAHDIFYGLKVTEDPAVVKALFCLMADQGAASPDGATPRDQQAAAILAGALQNNPTALKEVIKQWPDLMNFKCPNTGKRLSEDFYSSFMPSDIPTSADVKIPVSKAKAKTAAISGLIKSDEIRAEFLKNGGMQNLLEVLIPEGKEWAPAQRKVGQMVIDTFLDEDMGAKLGEWPNTPRSSDAQCREGEGQTGEGCWDYHVERIMKANKRDSDHWSKDLNTRLIKARKSGNYATGHQDL